MMIYIILLAGIFSAIGQYVDKHLANMGTSKNDYFYYMCLTMIPFSLAMVFIEYLTGQFKFEFSIISFVLLLLAMIVRYLKQHTIVGCLKYLNPYEDSAYLSLGIVMAFIIDVILGIEDFTIFSILSISITVLGVFCIANSKLKIKNLQVDLFIRILTTLAMSYITHFMLQHWSNAIFLLITNLLLTIIFSKNYNIKKYKENKKTLKWCLIQQTFGFGFLYLSNMLASHSVTLSSYIRPTAMVIILLISIFLKDKTKKPTIKQILGIIFIIIGIIFINY